MKIIYRSCLSLILLAAGNVILAQTPQREKLPEHILVPAGAEYKMSPSKQKKWGKLYRREWTTPVTFPVIILDTFKGGLKPIKAGGGNQTRSLHLESASGKKYALRSVNKTLGKVLPPEFLGTFLEDLVNDKVAMSHPYAAISAAYLAERAHIYHTIPSFVYLPKQPAIDSFEKFGNEVYLFEEKIDGNWKDADNLGNFEDFHSTDKLLEILTGDNKAQVNQKLYVRSRLFDMIINDWDRHEEQWEWGGKNVNGQMLYEPIPQDRDQAFFSYDGSILSFLFSVAGLKYFQPLSGEIRDVNQLNFEQRNLDRFFANQMTLTDWQAIAKDLQATLTDDVIDASLKQMPREVQSLSGNDIANKIKQRRDKMVDYATTYYQFLAKEVEVVGSKMAEQFEVKRLNDHETVVNVFSINNGQKGSLPFYSRTFNEEETEEVRVYGISGNDQFIVEGPANGIKIRLIGGDGKDTMMLTGGKVDVYDDHNNFYSSKQNARLHLSDKDDIHKYEFKSYLYDKKGLAPVIFFNNEDRLLVGLVYGITKHKWRKEPFAYKYNIGVNYSISQKGFSVNYKGLYPNVVGKWGLALAGSWDAVRWTNFFGLGNESRFTIKDINYYRARSEEWMGKVGLARKVGHSFIIINGLYQQVRIINDADKFTGKSLVNIIPGLFNTKRFGGAELLYNLHFVNDSTVPTKGIVFTAKAGYLQNLKESSRSVGDFNGNLKIFIPLVAHFSIASVIGGHTVTGSPEFYQYASLGGGQDVRAFRQNRFWGKTSFFASNELRYIKDVKSHIYNGKIGLHTFFDNGRVWLPGENSNVWHSGYGVGFLLSPFNKILADVSYGMSKDENLLQLRLTLPIR